MAGRRRASSGRVVRALVALGVGVCVILGCPPLWAQGSGQDTIRGQVSGPSGRPVQVRVQLQNQAGYVIDTVFSDSEGNFSFQTVRDGSYHVFVDDEKYRKTVVSAHVQALRYPVDTVYISLEPHNRSSSSRSGKRGNQQEVSVRELKAKFPKQALKEYDKGNRSMQKQDWQGAITHFQKAVKLAPDMYLALNNLGTAYLHAGRLKDAEAVFTQGLSADPNSSDAYINLGHVYYELQKYDRAEDLLSRGLKLNPGAALGYFFLGLTDVRTDKLESGEANLHRALDLNDPQVATAHLVLANLYLRTHRQAQAREQLESYLKAHPLDPQAGHIREVLAHMKAEAGP